MRQIPLAAGVLQSAREYILDFTPQRALIVSFLALSLVGTLLLKLPIASHQPTSWGQALFTAVSASTVTGLVVVDTGTHFTLFGQWVLLILIQAGGLGLMTFGLLIIQLLNGRLGLAQRAVLGEVMNQSGHADVKRLLLLLFGFTACMEIIGTALLALQWIPEMGFSRGLYYSFFHSISAFNNAGFGLEADSLTKYAGNPLVNAVISGLFITGGIGFIVVIDMLGKKRFRQYALHTKLMLIGTLVINLVAMLIVFLLEYGNPKTLGALPDLSDKLWAAWFQGVATRTAGFNTVDIAALLPATAFFMMGMMFIGAGSGSTASGIKLSTFIVLLLATRAFLFKQAKPVVLGRSIGSETVFRALAITVIGLFCVTTGTFFLAVTESAAFLDLAFEVVSAFGVGMSRGITASLSWPGQLVIMALMLIGRVGPLTLAFTLATARAARIQYPDGQVSVG